MRKNFFENLLKLTVCVHDKVIYEFSRFDAFVCLWRWHWFWFILHLLGYCPTRPIVPRPFEIKDNLC